MTRKTDKDCAIKLVSEAIKLTDALAEKWYAAAFCSKREIKLWRIYMRAAQRLQRRTRTYNKSFGDTLHKASV